MGQRTGDVGGDQHPENQLHRPAMQEAGSLDAEIIAGYA